MVRVGLSRGMTSLRNRTRKTTPEQLLLEHSTVLPNGCRIYHGRPDPRYCSVMIEGRRTGAHRLAYEIWVGPIPPGFHVHHSCGNKVCIEPTHLEAVSPRDHVLEKHAETIAPAISAAIAESARLRREQTHCVRGHEFTPENTWIRKEGFRQCRACLRERQRARRARGRAAA